MIVRLLCLVSLAPLCVVGPARGTRDAGTCSVAEAGAEGTSMLQAVALQAVVRSGETQKLSEDRLARRTSWDPIVGEGGKLLATQDGNVCTEDYYRPSLFESEYSKNVLAWTDTPEHLCASLAGATDEWIGQNGAAGPAGSLFSRMCKRGQAEKVLEPLAGLLRDPRFLCPSGALPMIISIDWLVLDDQKSAAPSAPGAKNYLFDAGGSKFGDATRFFAQAYQKRGIVFDHVVVWEALKQDYEAYWDGVTPEVRKFWEPRTLFHNGVPVTATEGDQHNPVDRIAKLCRPEDFCAFKLDIDTPQVEGPIVQQILDNRANIAGLLDEFFFEHHVHGLFQNYGWGDQVAGTYADSYAIFTKLRQLGIRAHSWI